jgi:hypothetical protein
MTIKITCNTCDTIEESCKQAIKLAIKNSEDVVFEFNGIEVSASPESDCDKLIIEYLIDYAKISLVPLMNINSSNNRISNNKLAVEFFDKVNVESLLPRYLNYDFKNNK